MATDRLLLRVPVFGGLLRKVAVARFARTLGTLLASGVPILDSLDIVAGSAGNAVIEQAIRESRTAIAEGHFRRTVDPEQFAFDVYGTMLMCHHVSRLLRDPKGVARARRAFEHLIAVARAA